MRPPRVASFAKLFREKLFVSLVAYADESGTHDETGILPGSEIVVVAGYVSWKDNWDIFKSEWSEVLREYKIEVFHMQECLDKMNGPKNPKWPYLGWSDDKRNSFVRTLISVALNNTLLGVGGALNVRDYNALSPEWLKSETEHPYHFCFQLFFDMLLPMLRQFDTPLDPDVQVAFFFDQNRQFEEKAGRAFHLIKGLRDHDNRMGSYTFADKKVEIQLQAADLIAYLVRSQQCRKLKFGLPITDVKPESWEELLISRRNVNVGLFDGDNLKKVILDLERDRLEFLEDIQ